ncbi:hypothetical protein [Fortiea contorta]|uniref:hypothetical protein n=1 Tax=Fortiea contorta TaxID=1892405 RepID=UPI000344D6E5|nr:hypothetical protein [Fortiea contorta]
MFPQVSRGKSALGFVMLLTSGIFIAGVDSAVAHKVKTAADVGATIHIEPNDQPRSGESAKTWFALTRRGGKAIPLKDCNCQLAVYAEPHTPKEPALLSPTLKPVVAERYQGIPGTEITFPKPGIYQLQLTGKPASGANFSPFKFNFQVTVAAGAAVDSTAQNSPNVNNEQENSSRQLPLWAIALLTVPIIGGLFMVLKGVKNENRQ